jgi:hypothetical protein
MVTGIPAQRDIHGYSYPVIWQNRVWLLNDNSYKRNSAICSSQDTVCVFNGSDSTTLLFGDESDITCGATLFTRFGGTIYDDLVVLKRKEVWMVDGTTPQNYVKFKIATSYGCVAPGTLKLCDLGYEVAPGLLKHVLLWQSDNALVLFDGNAVNPISDDIKNFFDPTKDEHIPDSMVHKSEGFYDSYRWEYHWKFASGANATTLNQEWVYDLIKKKWYQVDRGTGKYLQHGFEVRDTNGKSGVYAGIDTGYLERLENGTTFDGNSMEFTYRSGDIPLGNWNNTTKIRKVKHIAVSKSNTTNKVRMIHYGDGVEISEDVAMFSINDSKKRIVQSKESVDWGDNIFHSFECSLTTNNEEMGYEPIGLNINFKQIREDI